MLLGSGTVVDGQHLGVSSVLFGLKHPGCALLLRHGPKTPMLLDMEFSVAFRGLRCGVYGHE